MQVERHDLHHDFPNLGDEIHVLKVSNSHFSRLFDEYHVVTREIERLEGENIPVDDYTIEDMKKKRIKLKDELYRMIVSHKGGQ